MGPLLDYGKYEASLPATASPRTRMSFMITFGFASTR